MTNDTFYSLIITHRFKLYQMLKFNMIQCQQNQSNCHLSMQSVKQYFRLNVCPVYGLFLLLYFLPFADKTKAQNVIFDKVYNANIKSVQLFKSGNELSYPIIELNKNETLKLVFDDLAQDYKSYSYEILHCNADWAPSDLLFMQYMNGFEQVEITDFLFSSNTYVPYVHYELTIPNEYMKPIISGNYVIKVFETDHPDKTVMTKRFMVFQSLVDIQATVRNASLTKDFYSKQEIDFKIYYKNLNIPNVFTDLHVNIIQNNRWDNAIIDLKPVFVASGELNYNYQTGENTFVAGNEYRFFDTKSLQLIRKPVRKIVFEKGCYHVYIRDELIRSEINYQALPDINGRYAIYNQDAFNTNIDADYTYVHFNLPYSYPFDKGELYIIGDFTGGTLSDDYKMTYNELTDAYELTTLLKQGYYNYMYAYRENGATKGDVTLVEGSFSETENDYIIYVYVRTLSDISDKLVGVQFVNSLRDR